MCYLPFILLGALLVLTLIVFLFIPGEEGDDPRTHSRRPVRRGVQVPKLWVVHSRVGASPLRAPAENSSLNAFNLIETVTCLSD